MTQDLQEFDIVLADPPWRYDHSRSSSRRVENHYPTLTIAQIKTLGSRIPAAEDAVLFLWATAPKLREALEVMEAWGFQYKTNCVWDKQLIGIGLWFRGQHELLLVGTRGSFSPPRPSDRISSVINRRRGKHSEKPEDVQLWIEKAFPWATKLEMFARKPRPGWTVWGDEVRSTVMHEPEATGTREEPRIRS